MIIGSQKNSQGYLEDKSGVKDGLHNTSSTAHVIIKRFDNGTIRLECCKLDLLILAYFNKHNDA